MHWPLQQQRNYTLLQLLENLQQINGEIIRNLIWMIEKINQRDKYLKHHIRIINKQQARLQQKKREEKYHEYLLRKQRDEIKQRLKRQNQEKGKREKKFQMDIKQHSKFFQRLYFENLLHREYDDDELQEVLRKTKEINDDYNK